VTAVTQIEDLKKFLQKQEELLKSAQEDTRKNQEVWRLHKDRTDKRVDALEEKTKGLDEFMKATGTSDFSQA